MGINKKIMRKFALSSISAALVISAALCTAERMKGTDMTDPLKMIAAETTLPSGNFQYYDSTYNAPSPEPSETEQSAKQKQESSRASESSVESETTAESKTEADIPKATSGKEFESSEATAEEIEAYDNEHEGEEQYPVLEFTSVLGNMAYDGVQVKNSSSADIDIKSELEGRLGFKMEKTSEPQVLIYHTHTCESFLTYDTGYYYESFYPRTTDKSKSVCAVGEEIAKQLNAFGIATLHDTTYHDSPSYSGAYYRSTDTVNEYLEKYPSIKVVLDIHRDGIGTDTQRSKPVCYVNGKKAAQMMILAGYNCDNDPAFKDWEYNLRFALQIQNTAQKMYPDLVRPLNFGDFVYNMDINTGSLLIEIGADSNTLEEVRYTGYLLGNVLSEVLSAKKD